MKINSSSMSDVNGKRGKITFEIEYYVNNNL